MLSLQLIKEWRSRGELFDGETLLNADEELLMETGAARTVAARIVQKVKQVRFPCQPRLLYCHESILAGSGNKSNAGSWVGGVLLGSTHYPEAACVTHTGLLPCTTGSRARHGWRGRAPPGAAGSCT
jgi:hypothetical protein